MLAGKTRQLLTYDCAPGLAVAHIKCVREDGMPGSVFTSGRANTGRMLKSREKSKSVALKSFNGRGKKKKAEKKVASGLNA